MKLRINGEDRELDARDVRELLAALGMPDRKGVAVAVNGMVVPRSRWAERELSEGDEIEIVQATQGG